MEIKPNSITSKQRESASNEEPRVKRVTTTPAKKKEPSDVQKFVRGFLPDSSRTVKDYIISESPGLLKRFFRELLLGTINTFLPDTGYRASSSSQVTRTPYNKKYSSNVDPRVRSNNSVYDYDELVIEDYGEAVKVRNELYECLDQYNFVRVADLYTAVGAPSYSTDNNYGWYDLGKIEIIAVKEGYMLTLPRAVPRM